MPRRSGDWRPARSTGKINNKGAVADIIESKVLLNIDVMPSVYHQVGDAYLIHGQTSQVLDSINKRLSEEDKSLRTYRRALAFSQVRMQDVAVCSVLCVRFSLKFSHRTIQALVCW